MDNDFETILLVFCIMFITKKNYIHLIESEQFMEKRYPSLSQQHLLFRTFYYNINWKHHLPPRTQWARFPTDNIYRSPLGSLYFAPTLIFSLVMQKMLF